MGLSPKRLATRVPLMNQTTGSWPRAIETFAVASPRFFAAISIFQPVWFGSGFRPSRRGPLSWQR